MLYAGNKNVFTFVSFGIAVRAARALFVCPTTFYAFAITSTGAVFEIATFRVESTTARFAGSQVRKVLR